MYLYNPRQEDVHAALNHLFVSFLFVFQNDNDLIDNDNAGQSPAAQAVVLTFSLTYYHLNTVSFVSFYFVHSRLFYQHVFLHDSDVHCKARIDKFQTVRVRIIG